jgi:DUF438 domain-containing protein
MDEHEVIRRNMEKLERLIEKVSMSDSFEEVRHLTCALRALTHFFLETETHHKREEDALFPRLEDHGVTPRLLRKDHEVLRAREWELHKLAMNVERLEFEDFVDVIGSAGQSLTENLDAHIRIENHTLYPMALQLLRAGEWKAVRRRSDAIGYWPFVPDQRGAL